MIAVANRIFGDPPRAIPPSRVTEMMLDLLQLTPKDKVLEIGTGSATQSQAWAERCKELHTIELKPHNRCEALGNHVFFREGDGWFGIPHEAPFDAIVCTCGTRDFSPAWESQLADNGRMVVPIGGSDLQRLTLFRKKGRAVTPVKVAGYVRFSMMEAA